MSYYFDKFNVDNTHVGPLFIIFVFASSVWIGFYIGLRCMEHKMESKAIESGVGYYDSKTGEFKFVEVKG